MAITEVFPNPTVKQVIFQIRYPNLFYIEKHIGDVQLKIMKEFPNSSMALKRQVMITNINPGQTLDKALAEIPGEGTQKIWQFRSDKGVELNILPDSLDLSSTSHKTYSKPNSPTRFRDVIKMVLDAFFSVTKVPLIKRVGLRYVDECPFPAKNNLEFQKYFNSSFPLSRFKLEDCREMMFVTTVKRGEHFVRYVESLGKSGDKDILIMDFDGFAENINADRCLEVADLLHESISNEFEATIKQPVIDMMR